jgi:acetyl-CoA/propionyl-CoA carboxylase biotin carboxyl carrier protein
MLSKIIAWGPDRTTALGRLQRALSETVILGAVSNVSFLRTLASHPDVVAGRLDTEFIERQGEALIRRDPPRAAYAAYSLLRLEEVSPTGPVVDAWDVPSGWRPGQHHPLNFTVTCAGAGAEPVSVTVLGTPSRSEFRYGDEEAQAASLHRTAEGTSLALAGTTCPFWSATDGVTHWIFIEGDAWAMSEKKTTRSSTGSGPSDGDVRSPMPGRVIQLEAASDTKVIEGQALVVVEAMKMEHVLRAPRAGVAEYRVAVGDLVIVDQVVAHIRSLDISPSDQPEKLSAPTSDESS